MRDKKNNTKPERKRQSSKPSSAPNSAPLSAPTSAPAIDTVSDEKPERIAKRMARAGLCSRREAETWILDGRVAVNGKPLDTPAKTVLLSDKIEVDGKLLAARERTRLWLYNKPSGVLTTNRDPEGRPTLFDQLPEHLPRVLSVGRLDMNTEGLLLLTNDGGLARILELPATGWLRRYRVRAHGKADPEKLEGLKEGIAVDGVLYGSIEAVVDRVQGTNTWLTVSIREGKNREVKNVLAAIGLDVNRLIRVSYGPFQLGDLPSKQVSEIRGRTLREQLGERLVKQSGADFDAPIIHLNTPEKPEKKAEVANQKRQKKYGKKLPRGAIAPGTMERLGTRKQSSDDPARKPNKKFKRKERKYTNRKSK